MRGCSSFPERLQDPSSDLASLGHLLPQGEKVFVARDPPMLRYYLNRLLIGLGMLLALSVLIFVLLRLAPGDPVDAYINPNVPMSQEEMAATRARLGLDSRCRCNIWPGCGRPCAAISAIPCKRNGATVLGLIGERIGPTLLLMGAAIVIAIVVGIATGIIGAVRPQLGRPTSACPSAPSSASRARPS